MAIPLPPYGPLFADLTSSTVVPTGSGVAYSLSYVAYVAREMLGLLS